MENNNHVDEIGDVRVPSAHLTSPAETGSSRSSGSATDQDADERGIEKKKMIVA